jgi:uncharacterized membrane protein
VTTQINSTEIAGFLAFVPAALTSSLASFRTRNRADSRIWAIIAAVYYLLAIEILANTRFIGEDLLRRLLRDTNEYAARRPPQAAALLAVMALTIVVSVAIVRRVPGRITRFATLATIAVVELFICESVSLHAVDAILYAPAGPIILIGWGWLAFGWSTTLAAASVRRRT